MHHSCLTGIQTCPAAKAGSDEIRMPTHIQKLNIGGGTCRASTKIRNCRSLETFRAEVMLNNQDGPECHVLACHDVLQNGTAAQSQNKLWGRQLYLPAVSACLCILDALDLRQGSEGAVEDGTCNGQKHSSNVHHHVQTTCDASKAVLFLLGEGYRLET